MYFSLDFKPQRVHLFHLGTHGNSQENNCKMVSFNLLNVSKLIPTFRGWKKSIFLLFDKTEFKHSTWYFLKKISEIFKSICYLEKSIFK